MKFIKLELNLGHILSIIAMVGTLLGVWRAMEISAVETSLRVDVLSQQVLDEKKERQLMDDATSKRLEKVANTLDDVSRRQERVAGILQGKGFIDKP